MLVFVGEIQQRFVIPKSTEKPPTWNISETEVTSSKIDWILYMEQQFLAQYIRKQSYMNFCRQKSLFLGGHHKVVAIRHDLKYHVYGGKLDFRDIFSKKNW